MSTELTATDTTAGACTICARRTPAGMGALRVGAVVFGLGVAGGIAAWTMHADATLSALPFAAGAVIGLPLLAVGVRKVLSGGGRAFADGALTLSNGGVVHAGKSIEARVSLAPDHPLYVQSASLELIAVEIDASGTQRVLNVLNVPFAPGTRIEAPMERTQTLAIPSDWPLTMKAPDQKGVAPTRIESRLRLAIDFAAHPLFAREVPLIVSA